MNLSSLIKSADWKEEKHVPVITVEGQFAFGQPLDVEVSVGREVPHPNTIEHHIVCEECWRLCATGDGNMV